MNTTEDDLKCRTERLEAEARAAMEREDKQRIARLEAEMNPPIAVMEWELQRCRREMILAGYEVGK